MQHEFDKLNAKLDAHREHLHAIDKTLVRQEAHLAEHIRRTELAESEIGKLWVEIKPLQVERVKLYAYALCIGAIANVVMFGISIFKFLQ